MPAERYFVDALFIEGKTVLIEGQEFHHLVHVMRTRVGASVELVNGKGQLASAILQRADKHEASLEIVSVSEEKRKGKPLILAQAIPRFNRLEFILEKGTELGAAAFWLFPGAHSEKTEFSPNQQERMRFLTIAAMKQCGRLDLPEIVLKPPLSKWEKPSGHLFFGDTRPSAKPFPKCEGASTIFIGPESGFTPQEADILENQFQAHGVKLHDNILRVDTAAIAALSQLWQ